VILTSNALLQENWIEIGNEVYYMPTPLNESKEAKVFIGYAGWNVTDFQSQSWVSALASNFLVPSLGVTHLYAVGGPQDPLYENQTIANGALINDMLNRVGSNLNEITIAAHSSGSFVAHQFLGYLFNPNHTYDPTGITKGKINYFNLDGGEDGLDIPIIISLKKGYFVYSNDSTVNTLSPNHDTMIYLYDIYKNTSNVELIAVNSSKSECYEGAVWCVHMTLITQIPWNHSMAAPWLDYVDFSSAHPVTTSYFSYLTNVLDTISSLIAL